MPTAQQLTPPVAEHGEGPVWDVAGSRLAFVDLEVGDVLALTTDGPGAGAVRRAHVDAAVGVLRPRRSGGWVMALQRRFALLDAPLDDLLEGRAQVTTLDELWDDTDHRMNDGSCDPAGRFYAGSMAYDATPGQGTFWRLDADGAATLVMPGVTVSNGLGWSPDGSRAYYIDTPTHRVDRLHVDAAGDVVGREPFARPPADRWGTPGRPDGLSVDAEGGVWVALYGSGAIVRFDADGALTERLDVPTPQTTAVTFGGPDLDRLYITTSTQGLPPGSDPAAGALFTHDPGVRGQAPLTFAG